MFILENDRGNLIFFLKERLGNIQSILDEINYFIYRFKNSEQINEINRI